MNYRRDRDVFPMKPTDRADLKSSRSMALATDLWLFITSGKPDISQELIDKISELIEPTNKPFVFKFKKLQDAQDTLLAISEQKSVMQVAEQILFSLNKFETKTEPCVSLMISKLFGYIIVNHRNIIPPYINSMAMPKTKSHIASAICLSKKQEVEKYLKDVEFTAAEKKYDELSFIDTIKAINIKLSAQTITRTSLPVIDIFLEACLSWNYLNCNTELDLTDEERTNAQEHIKNASELIRFIMYVEKLSVEHREYELNEKHSVEDLIRSLLPYEFEDDIDLDIFGCVSQTIDSSEMKTYDVDIQNGKISREGSCRHNLIIFESVLIAMFMSDDFSNEIFIKLQGYLAKVLAYDKNKLENALKLVIPTLFRLGAYELDYKFGDSLSGSDQLNLEITSPLYNYPDVYGITYGTLRMFDVFFNMDCEKAHKKDTSSCINYVSHTPKITLEQELANSIWKNSKEDLAGFQNVLFDNNIEEAMKKDAKKEVLLKNMMDGYSRCVYIIGHMPEFIMFSKINSLDEVLHVILKATIGYPVHISMRKYEAKNEYFQDPWKLLVLAPNSNKSSNAKIRKGSEKRLFKLISNGENYHYCEVNFA